MDILRKYLTNNDQVLVYIIDATNMIKTIRNLHALSNVATAALGRSMMATEMMASMFKSENQRITTTIKGDGKLGSIVVCANGALEIKGYVTNPGIELPLNKNGKLDVAKAVGKGTLNIVKDIGLKEPFVGNCNLFTSEIAEDFAFYFYTSEQTPSVVSLGVLINKENEVEKACGYIISPLPNTDEETLDKLEKINADISSVTGLMLDLQNIDDVVKTITGDNNPKQIEQKTPKLKCDCSNHKIERVISIIGKDEAIKHVENFGEMEITCHFCNKVYNYSKEEIEKLFN
ncbi:MAG: Hsp33 family molecular chaperone HslO [Clostridia bacterium]